MSNKKANQHRIIWHQRTVDGKVLVKWHTGTLAECELLEKVCRVAGESYRLSRPGEFKP